MREILFRAKRKDNGEWVEGNVLQTDDGDCYIATSCLVGASDEPLMVAAYEVYPETLCQFTGKTDENGKEIFDKHIVSFIDNTSTESGYSERSCVGVVLWDEDECCFHVTNRLSAESWEVLNGCKVVGNVFDNTHLLDETGCCAE